MGVLVLALWLGARNAHAVAYDEARGVVVLFGGADARAVRGDTWILDGARWRLARRDGPPPRTFPVMAYDAARRQVVLWGGNRVLFGPEGATGTELGDTWVWNGRRWRRLAVPGPEPRAEAAAAYDRRRRRVVLFGGTALAPDGARRRFGDTWEFDGRAWTRVATTGPAARSGAAMAYDERRGRVVLFGGSGPPPSGETWEWDGARWERVPSGDAPGRFNSAAAGTPDGVLRFGGWDGRRRVAETWRYRDGVWTLLDAAGPAARNHAALAYDRARRRVILVGGHDGERVFGDTWRFDRAWVRLVDAPPEARVDNGH